MTDHGPISSVSQVSLTLAVGVMFGVDMAFAGSPCLQQRIVALDAATFDDFGRAVAVLDSGNALVGSPFDNDLGSDSGSAYVFRREGLAWSQMQKLLASDGVANDGLGFTVAGHGELAVVGAPGHRHWPTGGIRCGAAYIYRFNGTQWVQDGELVPSDCALDDGFGRAVAIRGDVALIGADLADPQGDASGAAYGFRHNPATGQWAQEQKLLPNDGQNGQKFGRAVAIEGDLALVGASGDHQVMTNAGAAYIFRFNGTNWVQEQKLLPDPGSAGGGSFGFSVSLSNGIAVIGRPAEGPAGSGYGAVYFFQHNGTQWVKTQKIIYPHPWTRSFGNAISIDGNFVLIGAHNSLPYGPPGHGAAYVYRHDGKQWVPHGPPLLVPPTVNSPFFGFSVGLSGTTGIVGAYGENSQRGAAYIYHVNPPMGDLNCDGLVNGLDLGILLSQWTTPGGGGGSADFNADDLVNGLDLGILLANWSLP
jgi:hypothetical protein